MSIHPIVRAWARRLAGVGVAAALASTGAVLAGPSSASAAAPVLFSDDFSDGDAAGWHTSRGRWAVINDVDHNNPALRQSSTTTAVARAGRSKWADYEVVARSTTTEVRPQAVVRRHPGPGAARRQPLPEHPRRRHRRARQGDPRPDHRAGHRAVQARPGREPHADPGSQRLDVDRVGRLRAGIQRGRSPPHGDRHPVAQRRDRPGDHEGRRHVRLGHRHVVRRHQAGRAAPLRVAAPKIVAVTPTTATITWTPTVDNVGVVDYIVYQGTGHTGNFRPVGTYTGTGPVTLVRHRPKHRLRGRRPRCRRQHVISVQHGRHPTAADLPEDGQRHGAAQRAGRAEARRHHRRRQVDRHLGPGNRQHQHGVNAHVLLVTDVDNYRIAAKVRTTSPRSWSRDRIRWCGSSPTTRPGTPPQPAW